MKNKIEDLRDHLFATLEALQDQDTPMDVGRAKTISDVAQTIINSAKVEVDYLNVTGAVGGSGFIPDSPRSDTPKLTVAGKR
ncbi:MAG: hypothetical protein GY703_09600 [Gammaproteobacteria bacterium]|nr:hypothetical protein [Gammaproteobacteria bacterium]